MYTLILDSNLNRDQLINDLNQMGIESRPTFSSLSKMPPYKSYKKSLDLDNSNLLSRNGISLPSSTMLNKIQLKFIIQSFSKILKNSLNN